MSRFEGRPVTPGLTLLPSLDPGKDSTLDLPCFRKPEGGSELCHFHIPDPESSLLSLPLLRNANTKTDTSI